MNVDYAWVGLVVAVLTSVGCERAREREASADPSPVIEPKSKAVDGKVVKPVVTNGVVGVASTPAVGRLIDARCEREQACNNVGLEKRYATLAVCTERLGEEAKNDLDVKTCPRGVDAKALDACLDAVQKQPCPSPTDSGGWIATCRAGALCLK